MSMNAPAFYTSLRANGGLSSVEPGTASRGRMAEVAEQFEAMFLQLVLKSMRETTQGDPLFDSSQTDQYRDLMDSQLALTLASRRSTGIADAIERQLSGLPQVESAVSARTGVANPDNFISSIRNEAEQTAAQLGVDPRAIMAQAALETGWGRSILRHADGTNSHNLFGIKAGPDWEGSKVSHMTTEYVNGQLVRRRETFRAYDSYAEAFADYRSVLTADRYRPALSSLADSREFGHALQKAGYATDPYYGEKIRRIMEGEQLEKALPSTGMDG